MKPITERLWYFSRYFVPERLLRFYERLKWHREIIPIPLPEGDCSHRVLITPARHAGQGKLWSDALNSLDGVSARSVTVQNAGFGHDADYKVSWVYATLSKKWQSELRRVLSTHYTHILVEASTPPLGGSFGGNFTRQIEWLQHAGLHVGFIAHGSEVRIPSRHVTSEKWSPFNAPEAADLTRALETVATKNAALYSRFDVPSFVSTAGLMLDIPGSSFLGLALDIEKYATDVKPFMGEKLVACHVSSHSVLKATAKLNPILKKLEAEGWIEFREYVGISHEEVPAILASSDIVLDQFALGDYGVFACEGLAAGRLVLSHVSEQVRSEILQNTSVELPIPETTLDNIEWRLRDIAENLERYREIARRGPSYVRQVHDGRFSAQVLYKNFLAVE